MKDIALFKTQTRHRVIGLLLAITSLYICITYCYSLKAGIVFFSVFFLLSFINIDTEIEDAYAQL